MDSNQSGGGDSLLESPRIDATIKVYRGGGREDTGAKGETYLGVGGTPVQRHQVSLYTTPVKRRELKVYKGGGDKEPGDKAMFRGKGIEEFEKNPELYTSMVETGKKVLQLHIGEGVKSSEIDIENKDALKQLTLENDVISTDTLHSCFIGKQFTFTLIPKLLNGFIYGEKKSNGDLEFRSQLLVFSTVLQKQDTELKGSLTEILTNFTAGLETDVTQVATGVLEGAKTTLTGIADAVGTSVDVGEPTLKRKNTPVAEVPLDTSIGMLGLLELQIEGDIWILKHKANVDRSVPNLPTIFLGPYWLRDPEALTAESFFSNLTKSELLYMNDIIFKGYPYSVIKSILLEKKEDFFNSVWKPLLNNNVMDDFTFQLLTEIEPARKLLAEIRTEQEERLSIQLDSYLQGYGANVDEEADPLMNDHVDVPLPKKEKNEEWTEEGAAEGKAEGKGAAEDKAKGEAKAEGEEGEDEAKGEEENESKSNTKAKNEENCQKLLGDTSTDPIVVYLRSLLASITKNSIKNSTGSNSTLASITQYVKDLKRVLKTSPTSTDKKIQTELTFISNFAETFIHELAKYAATAKETRTRAVTGKLGKYYEEQGDREHDLQYVICGLYSTLKRKNSKGGFRKTRKLAKTANTVKAKHDK
jgi:hypothetical protein